MQNSMKPQGIRRVHLLIIHSVYWTKQFTTSNNNQRFIQLHFILQFAPFYLNYFRVIAVMSMKVLPRHNHKNCNRQNCLGHTRDYDNYLNAVHKIKSKVKVSKTSRSYNSLHQQIGPTVVKIKKKVNNKSMKVQIAQKQQLKQWQQRNEELSDQLQQKSRRINELKHKLKDCESRLKHSQTKIQQLQTVINQNQHPKSPITNDRPTQNMINHYQQQLKLLQTSQKATLETMQKYRQIEHQFHQYRSDSERKMEKILRENEQLRMYEPPERQYDQQISQLRKQLAKLSECKSKEQRSFLGISLQNQIIVLRSTNRELMTEKEGLLVELQQKHQRERQLRTHLNAINKKVELWEDQYNRLITEKRNLEQHCEYLQSKYNQKKEKSSKEKQEWAGIFRELMREVQKLKGQIGQFERVNHQKHQFMLNTE